MSEIVQSLKPGMTTPDVVRCCDRHFRRAVYGIGSYSADYPEQALLCCIVQGWCPKFVFISHFSPSCLCLTRCTARHSDLDNSFARNVLRSCEHTEMLVKEFELGDLWDDYGLVGDIIVRFSHMSLSRIVVPLDVTPLRRKV
jgi:hypothetical protein